MTNFVFLPMFNLRPVLFMFALIAAQIASATHNRAGEIIVCHIGGANSLLYEVTIITHTKISAPADRPELVLDWGDGTIDTIARTNIEDLPAQDVRRNTYVATHTYAGPGTFTLQFDDQNRNGGVINVPNSIAQSFCVQTTLSILPTTGNNCSARFANSPIQDACLNQTWVHNPAAYDLDGDSLSYEQAICLGINCEPIPGYQFPGPNYSIDPLNGTITWNAPNQLGEYNIAFIVREWRRNEFGVVVNVGSVMRDMQITVLPCSNQPPIVADIPDTCVEAGTLLNFTVQASDPNTSQNVTLNALGQPFIMPNSPATFLSPTANNPVNGIFNWNTNCSHVRLQPYQVVFSALDNGEPVALQNYSTMNITVVAPAPQNPVATAVGSQIELSWEQSVCSNAIGYHIYRRSGFYGFDPDHCETGVPGYTGYSFLAEVNGVGNTSFIDENDLVFGNEYCYMVIAVFADGAESYASIEFCSMLDRQVPVITNVSVEVTDPSEGVDTIRWSNAYDLDTLLRPGPYKFLLYRGTGFNNADQLIWESSTHPFIAHPDTQFIDTFLNTEQEAHVYRVVLLGANGTDTIGSSNVASSVFISADPNDEQVTISWEHNTPWINYEYEVYRETAPDVWTLVGTSTTESFVDTGLVNGQEYCYYVISYGEYSDTTIVSPLINYSQEVCGVPVDLTPPCVPIVSIDNDCERPLNTLTWTNPNNACEGTDDTFSYNIYFTPELNGEMELIATIDVISDTIFTHTDGASVAGCYSVTAIDSVGNESAFSEMVCGDNCPEYELPNIFTPNGDRNNDLFGPFPYRGVKEIDIEIFNRWGQVVFKTTDPDIDWGGTLLETAGRVPDGVYYYVCTVIFHRLEGPEPVVLQGYVHIAGSGVPAQLD